MDCKPPYDVVVDVPGPTILTPNYRNYGYEPNLDCQLTLSFEDKIAIVFEDFSLQNGSSCQYDWLEVHHGDVSNSDLIGQKLCGNDIPSPIESIGNSMTLVFHSDNNFGRGIFDRGSRGFKIVAHQGT